MYANSNHCSVNTNNVHIMLKIVPLLHVCVHEGGGEKPNRLHKIPYRWEGKILTNLENQLFCQIFTLQHILLNKSDELPSFYPPNSTKWPGY